MNANEYGVVIAFFTAYDMSANTGIAIEFWSPGVDPLTYPPSLTVTNPAVTVPSIPFVTPGPTFPANEYAQYTTVQGDFAIAGTWSARVKYNTTTPVPQQLISTVGTFTVGP